MLDSLMIAFVYIFIRSLYIFYCHYRRNLYMSKGSQVIGRYKKVDDPLNAKGVIFITVFVYIMRNHEYFMLGLILMIYEYIIGLVKHKKEIVILEDGMLYDMKHIMWKQVFQIQCVDEVLKMKTNQLVNWKVEVGTIEKSMELMSDVPKLPHINFEED